MLTGAEGRGRVWQALGDQRGRAALRVPSAADRALVQRRRRGGGGFRRRHAPHRRPGHRLELRHDPRADRRGRAILAGQAKPETLGIHALDAHTLEIRLKAPTPYFLSLLTHSTTYPIHRPSLAEFGERFTRPGNLVSNGAYQLSEAVVQSHITLSRNPHYWDNAHTRIDKVRYSAIEDASSEFKRYRAGEVDWGSVPTADFAWAKANLGEELHIHPYLGVYFYGLNLTRTPFKDAPALRRALTLAVDREILTEDHPRQGDPGLRLGTARPARL